MKAVILQKKVLLAIVLFMTLGIALLLRLRLALLIQFPGHGDYAFYFTVAKNLANGRGLQIDYVWHYLNGLPPLPHYSNDFWMPLTSILAGISMMLGGKSLFAAVLPSILAAIALAGTTYLTSKTFSDSELAAWVSAGVILFLPLLFKYSLLTDSAIFYALWSSTSLLCILRGMRQPRFFLLAAFLIGVAHLTRQDGLLLLAPLSITLLFAPMAWKSKFQYGLLCLGIYGLVLSPLLVTNLRELGRVLPAGPSKTMFMTTYEDFYTYRRTLSLQTYLEWGINNILAFKLEVAAYNVRVILDSLGWPLALLAAAGIGERFGSKEMRPRRALLGPPVLYLGVIYTFYTLVASFSSFGTGFRRSLIALMPFLVCMAADFAVRRIRWQPAIVFASAASIIFLATQSYAGARALLLEHNQLGQELAPLGPLLRQDAQAQGISPDEIVLMARDVWEVQEASQVKVIQIPNDDLPVILEVARHYGANYVLLPARREALEGISSGSETDEHFTRVAQLPDSSLTIFRISTLSPP